MPCGDNSTSSFVSFIRLDCKFFIDKDFTLQIFVALVTPSNVHGSSSVNIGCISC